MPRRVFGRLVQTFGPGLSTRTWSYHAAIDRSAPQKKKPQDELDSTARARLPEERAEMAAHAVRADLDLSGDFFVREAQRDELAHRKLARREAHAFRYTANRCPAKL